MVTSSMILYTLGEPILIGIAESYPKIEIIDANIVNSIKELKYCEESEEL